ncbi:MAG: redox-regulated ATPase YchF [Verrucomicrobiia bacterium]|jgi:GTP-binding protein YchF
MLKAGIIGLPNVGKSTLFNAITRSRKAAAENYPFCTIEPNLGTVYLQDERLDKIAQIAKVATKVPTSVEFVDIAGLVKGASKGEGLGNKFLSHIREVDAIVHVVRCFEDPDIAHIPGTIDPIRDIEIVNYELIIADLELLKKRRERISKEVKHGDKHAVAEDSILQRIEFHLNDGKPVLTFNLSNEEREIIKECSFLTDKPTIFVANLKESSIAKGFDDPFAMKVKEYAQTHYGCDTIAICAQLESELADLEPEEALQYLNELGIKESGLNLLIKATYKLLGLRTFFTFNDKEVRAWTVRAGTTAVKAAGKIHSDFERGFIKAEVIHWDKLVECGSVSHAREKGYYKIEGRDYVVNDGDIILFKFNV